MRTYRFRRYSAGVSPVRQDNRAAPARHGWWAFPEGFEHGADNVPSLAHGSANRRGQRWHTLTLDGDALIYVGWDRSGTITRDGYFNQGDWQLMTVADAMQGLDRMVAWGRGYAASHPGYSWRRALDMASTQVFIPASSGAR